MENQNINNENLEIRKDDKGLSSKRNILHRMELEHLESLHDFIVEEIRIEVKELEGGIFKIGLPTIIFLVIFIIYIILSLELIYPFVERTFVFFGILEESKHNIMVFLNILGIASCFIFSIILRNRIFLIKNNRIKRNQEIAEDLKKRF